MVGKSGGVGGGIINAMDRQGSRGTAKDVSELNRGSLFTLNGFLASEGPDLPCHSGFGSASKAVPARRSMKKLLAMRRDIMAMATRHVLVMAR